MGTFVFIAVAVLAFAVGLRAVGCETVSVSFTRDVITCYENSSGDFPGGPAGAGLMALGALFALVGFGRRRR